jgi:hypothetical protein
MFFVFFYRIKESNGVIDDIDNQIKSIANKNKLSIEPVHLKDDGETRIYKVDFDINHKLALFDKELWFNQNVDTRDVEIIKLANEAVQMKSGINSLVKENNNLNQYQIALNNEQNRLYEVINLELDKLSIHYKKMLKIALSKPEHINVNESFVSGNIKDYYSLTHKQRLFAWSKPNPSTSYPDQRRLAKGVTALFAKSYNFEVASLKDVSERYTNLLEAIQYINKPHIQIQAIDFNIEDETWLIKAKFFEGVNK